MVDTSLLSETYFGSSLQQYVLFFVILAVGAVVGRSLGFFYENRLKTKAEATQTETARHSKFSNAKSVPSFSSRDTPHDGLSPRYRCLRNFFFRSSIAARMSDLSSPDACASALFNFGRISSSAYTSFVSVVCIGPLSRLGG